MGLDFSEFHPLDHHIWEQRCKELPKAAYRTTWGYHLHNAWSYKWRSNIQYRFYKHVLCHFNIHKMQEIWYPRDKRHAMLCVGCDKREELPWDGDPMERIKKHLDD